MQLEDGKKGRSFRQITAVVASVVLLFSFGAIGAWWFLRDNPESTAVEGQLIDWRLLRELNFRTGAKTARLEDVNGKLVRLPGFVVPLEDEARMVKEFLFVPTMQACIHVPPPPPNQMLYVLMKEGFELDWSARAFWLEGVLRIAEKESPYGNVSYQMEGTRIEPYNPNRY